MENTIQAIVTNTNNQLTTTSKNIADVFGKQHRDVLKAIDNVIAELPEEWGVRNFAQGVYTLPETADQQHRMFNITRDGFTLLAMGFTGKKALAFKLAYIDQFNAMEKALSEIQSIPEKKTKQTVIGGLTADQCDAVKALVKARAEALPQDKRAKATINMWSAVKSKFGKSYKEVAPEEYTNVVSLIARVELEGELILAGTPAPVQLEEPTSTPQPTATPTLQPEWYDENLLEVAFALAKMLINLLPEQRTEAMNWLAKKNHHNMQILGMFINKKMTTV